MISSPIGACDSGSKPRFAADGPELRRSSREEVLPHHALGSDWVLLDGETPVSCSVFNAMLPDIVQIGGVWTPPPLRGRGYGRSVVAGSLLAAREQGVQRAVLFADPQNPAAKQAYLALGFRIGGDYGLVLLPQYPTHIGRLTEGWGNRRPK